MQEALGSCSAEAAFVSMNFEPVDYEDSAATHICLPSSIESTTAAWRGYWAHVLSRDSERGDRLRNSMQCLFQRELSYYNKRNAHFDVQELLLQFWTERRETWQEYGEA